MNTRLSSRLTSALRSSTRRTALPSRAVRQRLYSSEAHASGKTSSDLPWMVGAGLTFGVTSAWLLSPAGPNTKQSHAQEEHHEEPKAPEQPVKMTDDEGKEEDVSKEMAKAEAEDSPKSDGADVPATKTKYDDGHPAASSDHEPEIDQKEKPGSGKKGTFQGESESNGPTNLGTARAAATSKTTPKQASSGGSDSEASDKKE